MYKNVILFLILVFFHAFSYGKPEPLFPEQQTSTEQIFENQKTLEEKKNLSNLETSSLNIRAEAGGGYIYGTLAALLEFQTSIIKSKKLRWLIQAGAGSVVAPLAGGLSPYFPIDTGLRYNFHPFNVSMRGGIHVISRKETDVLFKGTLSVGWNIGYNIHIELTGGIFDISPLLGLSVSLPLIKW